MTYFSPAAHITPTRAAPTVPVAAVPSYCDARKARWVQHFTRDGVSIPLWMGCRRATCSRAECMAFVARRRENNGIDKFLAVDGHERTAFHGVFTAPRRRSLSAATARALDRAAVDVAIGAVRIAAGLPDHVQIGAIVTLHPSGEKGGWSPHTHVIVGGTAEDAAEGTLIPIEVDATKVGEVAHRLWRAALKAADIDPTTAIRPFVRRVSGLFRIRKLLVQEFRPFPRWVRSLGLGGIAGKPRYVGMFSPRRWSKVRQALGMATGAERRRALRSRRALKVGRQWRWAIPTPVRDAEGTVVDDAPTMLGGWQTMSPEARQRTAERYRDAWTADMGKAAATYRDHTGRLHVPLLPSPAVAAEILGEKLPFILPDAIPVGTKAADMGDPEWVRRAREVVYAETHHKPRYRPSWRPGGRRQWRPALHSEPTPVPTAPRRVLPTFDDQIPF